MKRWNVSTNLDSRVVNGRGHSEKLSRPTLFLIDKVVGLFTQKILVHPPKKSEKSEKIQKIQGFFEDLKSAHLIWE